MLARERSTAFVLSLFGGLALLLASVGLYGTISYSVAQRRREFGIRLALGAQHGNIKKLVLREGLATVAAGLIIGLPCSMVLSRFVGNQLHGMSPLDPASYIAIALLWILVSVLAVLAPARKAISNPLEALRVE
jgi:ABC-type antimicrobial peptide transport system permease subunit